MKRITALLAGGFLVLAAPMAGGLPGGLLPGGAAAETASDDGGDGRMVDLAARLDGSDWRAVLAGDMALEAEDGVTLSFAGERIAGRSGCNRFMGNAEAGALTQSAAAAPLTIGPVAGTRMACPGRADEVETRFLAALEQVDGFLIDAADRLLLLAGRSVVIVAVPVSED